MNKNQILDRWPEYVTGLYNDKRGDKSIYKEVDGPPILEEEIVGTLKNLKKNNSAGLNNIATEMIYLQTGIGTKKLSEMASIVYETE